MTFKEREGEKKDFNLKKQAGEKKKMKKIIRRSS